MDNLKIENIKMKKKDKHKKTRRNNSRYKKENIIEPKEVHIIIIKDIRVTESHVKDMTQEEIHEEQDKELEMYIQYSHNFLCIMYDSVSGTFKFCYKIIKFFIKITGVYLVWIILHFTASQLYVKLCVPNSITGFLISPFITATPHCQGLRWIVYNAANVINNMWAVLGSWICYNILFITNRENFKDDFTGKFNNNFNQDYKNEFGS
jgi:hypothetical protein